jgi:hypothetical protein
MKKAITAAALTLATLTLVACNGNGNGNWGDKLSNPTGKVFGPDASGTGAPRTDDSTYPHRYDNGSGDTNSTSGGSSMGNRGTSGTYDQP